MKKEVMSGGELGSSSEPGASPPIVQSSEGGSEGWMAGGWDGNRVTYFVGSLAVSVLVSIQVLVCLCV